MRVIEEVFFENSLEPGIDFLASSFSCFELSMSPINFFSKTKCHDFKLTFKSLVYCEQC